MYDRKSPALCDMKKRHKTPLKKKSTGFLQLVRIWQASAGATDILPVSDFDIAEEIGLQGMILGNFTDAAVSRHH